MKTAQARYTAIYQIQGISKLPDDEASVELPMFCRRDLHITLCFDAEKHFFHVDRSRALSAVLSRALFVPRGEESSEQLVLAEEERCRARRMQNVSKGAFLVFEAAADIEAPSLDVYHDAGEYAICFDCFDPSLITGRVRPLVRAAIVATGLSLKDNVEKRVRKIGSVVYITNTDTAKPVYCLSGRLADPDVYVTGPISREALENLQRRAIALSEDDDLERVSALLAESHDKEAGKLHSFISGWSALEILVNKTFKATYKTAWSETIRRAASPPVTLILDRVDQVMTDKYSLIDKFMIVAVFLDPGNASDTEKFKKTKAARDKIFHEGEASISAQIIEDAQYLARKYLFLHLDRKQTTA